MPTPPSLPTVTLWRIQTRNSIVSCRLVRPDGGGLELHLTQGDDIVVAQPFPDEESLRSYADALRERLRPLGNLQSQDADSDWKAS